VEHGANGEREKLARTLQGVQAGRIHADTMLTIRAQTSQASYLAKDTSLLTNEGLDSHRPDLSQAV
jgi:hypothetical protein